ncbi:MAG: NUDIX hydrolase [Candidatus Micrarchaeales archaeon]
MPKRVLFRWGSHTVEEEEVKVKGKKITIRRVTSKNSVCIMPIFGKDSILIERQYRKGINKYIYELPAGQMEKGEKPINAARRELEEETGYRAGKLKFLFKTYLNPGLETEVVHHFLASDLVKTKQGTDEDEYITPIIMKMSQIVKMIKKQQIRDNDTLVGILHYLMMQSKKRR